MASCISIQSNGRISFLSVPVSECQSFILLEAGDWPGATVWVMPTPAEAAAAWSAGFAIPVVVFVIAAACRQLIKMFD